MLKAQILDAAKQARLLLFDDKKNTKNGGDG